ncbi:MAG: winged helix-turn-helix transcriptional regulator [Clostridia bacterium]|nr:winged helix-turn-helix transcriptional regulator [Clostridia bacterium]
MVKEKIDKITNDSFAKSIIELKLLSNRLSEGKGVGSGVFTVKYQILYLIALNGQTSPQELIFELNMAKSNLALIAKKMINEGLIVRTKETTNKKQIYYMITEKGSKELAVKMNAIENLYSGDSKEMLKHLNKTVTVLRKVK